jgi:hypothetical protein
MWLIEPAAIPEGTRHLSSKELVLKQRLLPTGISVLEKSVTKAEAGKDVGAGTELIEVAGGAGATFCEGAIAPLQACFMDANSDGAFDTAFLVRSQTPKLVMVSSRMPKRTYTLSAPISYTRGNPADSKLGTFVAIERRNYFNIYGRENFMILFGTDKSQERISDPVGFKTSELPKRMNILGAEFEALSEADGKLAVRVDKAMPAQPFGVTQTVAYR